MRVYSEARGISQPDATTYGFCLALSLFRMAAILAGVGARAAQGNASSRTAEQVGNLCLTKPQASPAFTCLFCKTEFQRTARCGE